jgi:propanol-preferring alcohol dehydrogenase
MTDGQIIGLFGFGASAHIVIQIIKHKFPTRPVFVFTRSPKDKQLAVVLRIAYIVLRRITHNARRTTNYAIDFSPAGESVRPPCFPAKARRDG